MREEEGDARNETEQEETKEEEEQQKGVAEPLRGARGWKRERQGVIKRRKREVGEPEGMGKKEWRNAVVPPR